MREAFGGVERHFGFDFQVGMIDDGARVLECVAVTI